MPTNDFPMTNGAGDSYQATENRGTDQVPIHYPKMLIHGAASGGQGSKRIVTPGTPVQLSATSVPCRWVKFTAFEGNDDVVVLGLTNAVRAGATGGAPDSGRTGMALGQMQTEPLEVSDLNLVWLDGITAGDGGSFVYGV